MSTRPNRAYLITAGFKCRVSTDKTFTGYGDLYRRVTAIANARISQLMCSGLGEPPQTRVLRHGWCSLGESNAIATAFVTMGLVCPGPGDAVTPGEEAPTAEALMSPGGATREDLTRVPPQRADELYSAFDFADPSTPAGDPVMLSYGESVPECEAINFQPFVQRAEKLAGFYHDLLQTHAGESRAAAPEIVRREWFCVTNPNLVTVHVFFASL